MSNKEIISKYNENNKLIYIKYSDGHEYWKKYDKNNNLIYYKDFLGYEKWREYDKNNNVIYYKSSDSHEYWCKWENNKKIEITEKEYKYIQYNIRIKEYNSRTKCSRFELMEI